MMYGALSNAYIAGMAKDLDLWVGYRYSFIMPSFLYVPDLKGAKAPSH